MKIKKPLVLFLSLLFVPCFLTSCSFVEKENQNETVEEKIDYNDINQMNAIYDQTETGNFLQKKTGPSAAEYGKLNGKVIANTTYEIEGGQKYASTYGAWAIQNFLELEYEDFLSKNPNPEDETYKLTDLTPAQIQEWLENCYLILNEKSEEISSCLYVTITCHIKNIDIEVLTIYYD